MLIHKYNIHEVVEHTVINGEPVRTGLVPRNVNQYPPGYYKSIEAVSIPLIPDSEWKSRIADRKKYGARLQDIRDVGANGQPIPILDQGNRGFCWTHSAVNCCQILRAIANQPYVPLSAYAIACMIKNFRDEGGWSPLALDYITKNGVPAQSYWPQGSMDRTHNNAETWKNAALHKPTEAWVDLDLQVYDRNLSFQQEISCLLAGFPVMGDFYWWGHSVCILDAVDGTQMWNETRMPSGKIATLQEFEDIWDVNETGGIGVDIFNSWKDWGRNGIGTLAGTKAIINGGACPRFMNPSVT